MKIVYRPDIDGLRCIAVIAVIFYHAQISISGNLIFTGGYIGVDIFFVISGYLITSIISNELFTTGKFSYFNFYERRVRRIVPVLLVVMLASLCFAWIILLPDKFITFIKSIFFSLGFISNIFFYNTGQEYAAQSSLFIPLLHTWSLSLEIQYYILFPLLLFFLFKFFKKYLFIFLIIFFISSLLFADIVSSKNNSSAFYFIHTRIWEFLLGSFLSYFEINFSKKKAILKKNNFFTILGVCLVAFSIIYFDHETYHPSIFTLIPLIGICLIIWFSNKDNIITKILSTKFFVYVGKISYSLFVWHYPIFVFARLNEFDANNIYNKFILAIILISISIASYYFIELPFRNRKLKLKYLISFILILYLSLISIGTLVIKNEGYKTRLPKILQEFDFKKSSWDALRNLNGEICNNKGCIFNDLSDKKVYLIGDSQVATLMLDLTEKLMSKNYKVITSTYGGCPQFPGFIKNDCDERDRDFLSLYSKFNLNDEKNSIFILNSTLSNYSEYFSTNKDEGWWDIAASKFIIDKLAVNNDVIIINPIPLGDNIFEKIFRLKINKIYSSMTLKEYNRVNDKIFKFLNSLNKNNIHFVYPEKLFCNNKKENICVINDEETIYYLDEIHISYDGSKLINNLIIDSIKKIEMKNNNNKK